MKRKLAPKIIEHLKVTGPRRMDVWDGRQYRWADAPNDIANLPREALSPPRKIKVDFSKTFARFSKGTRNNGLTSIAGHLRHKNLPPGAIVNILQVANEEVCDPPLPRVEVLRIARSISRYASEQEEAFGTLADVTEEEVQWLAKPYLVKGTTTVLDGNPGLGKSTFVTAIAAAITNGTKLPFSPDLEHGVVLFLSAEDDPARVLKPRLLANGADVTKVRFQQEIFTLDDNGLGLLRTEIEQWRPSLVVIDPLYAYMESGTDLNKSTDMTHFMVALDKLAREFDCCVLVVRHLRKSEAGDPLFRGLGSIAIAARVRSALILARHPADEQMRAVAHAKCNYAQLGATILFRFASQGDNKPPRVVWEGTDSNLTADDLLAPPITERGRPSKEREEAINFLQAFLEDGGQLRSSIDRAARARDIKPMTLRRAADELQIIKEKQGKNARWRLP